MAVKILRQPSKIFRIECMGCDALLEYEIIDVCGGSIQCPCCQTWNNHDIHQKVQKESEDTE